VSGWLSAIDMLPEIAQRLIRVQIECNDFRKVINTYDTQETFFYLDPPYVPDTRRAGQYRCEMSIDDHKDLVDILLKIKGKAMLSGYEHNVYKPLEQAGWIKIKIEVRCRATGTTKGTKYLQNKENREKLERTECVWLNYNVEVQS